MITAAQLAGFLAAHAVWSASDGEALIPMLGYTAGDNTRHMVRLAVEDLAVAVEQRKRKLEANDMDADDAVLLYDGRMSLDNTKVDAIIVEMRAYFSPESLAIMAIPYTPPSSGAFCLRKPKLLVWDDC